MSNPLWEVSNPAGMIKPVENCEGALANAVIHCGSAQPSSLKEQLSPSNWDTISHVTQGTSFTPSHVRAVVKIILERPNARCETDVVITATPSKTGDFLKVSISTSQSAVAAQWSWRLFLKYMTVTVTAKPFCHMKRSSLSVTNLGSMFWNCKQMETMLHCHLQWKLLFQNSSLSLTKSDSHLTSALILSSANSESKLICDLSGWYTMRFILCIYYGECAIVIIWF